MKKIRDNFYLLFVLIAVNIAPSIAIANVSLNILFAAPAEREMFAAPVGYSNCYSVAAGFENNLWINAHTVCEYGESYAERIWVGGYWRCGYRNPHACAPWFWVPPHWIQRGRTEYGIVWRTGPNHHGRPWYKDHYDHRYYDRHDWHDRNWHGHDKGRN